MTRFSAAGVCESWPCVDRTGCTSSSCDVLCGDGFQKLVYHRNFKKPMEDRSFQDINSLPSSANDFSMASRACEVITALPSKEWIGQGLLEWRNTTDSNGHSPAQKLYGHPLQFLCWQFKEVLSQNGKQRRTRLIDGSRTEYVAKLSTSIALNVPWRS